MKTKNIFILLFIFLFAGLVMASGPNSAAEGQTINQFNYGTASLYSPDASTFPLLGMTLVEPKSFITQKDQNKQMGIFDQLPGNLSGMMSRIMRRFCMRI